MAGPIRIAVLANTKRAQSELGGLQGRLQATGKAIGALGGVFAGLAIAGAVKQIVKSASDAQQSLGATETVFGKFSGTVIKTSQQAATKFGLSANQYRENANLLGSLFKNQGVAMDQLGGKTEKMIGTAADLAATFGGTTKDAVEALGSAFKGEFDPLERYGISLKQSTVNSEAMRIANVKSQADWGRLTLAQQRAATQQATTSLIMQQAGGALGAFSRESNTLANRQQVLSARFEDIKAKVGTLLLPVLTTLANLVLTRVLPAVERFGRFMQANVIPVVHQVAAAIAARLGPALVATGNFIGTQVVPRLAQFVGWIRTQVIPVAQSLAANYLAKLRQGFDFVRAAVQRNRPQIDQVVAAGRRFITVSGQIAAVVVTRVIPFLARLSANTLPVLGRGIAIAIGIVASFVRTIGTIITTGQRVVAFFRGLPGTITRSVSGFGSLLRGAGQRLIQGLIDGISSKIQAVKDKMSELTGWIKNHLPGSPVKVGPLRSWNNGGAGKRLVDTIITGMQARRAALEREVAGLSRIIDQGVGAGPVFAAQTSSALRAGVAAAPVVLNVYALADGPDVGRRVIRAIRDYERDVDGGRWRKLP